MTMTLTSPAFAHGAEIPVRFTCDGEETSPPLRWANLPDGTKSLALIIDDPDVPDPAAPKRTFVHWVLYDIPSSENGLAEGASNRGLPPGARQAQNDGGDVTYCSPCPPRGRHRYFHKLFAVDRIIGQLANNTRAGLLEAMEGHVLARAELIGTYERSRVGA
jgi:Raf kinase inhibitor-like YbhB/YbcL family protein